MRWADCSGTAMACQPDREKQEKSQTKSSIMLQPSRQTSCMTCLPEESTVSLEETIATQLRQRGWHLALAETTTGGLIAVRLVRLAGSSAYFDRSIVAYSKEAKLQSLGVESGVFDRSGSVSIDTACAMADGLHHLS